VIQRVALNFGPADPQSHNKHIRNARRQNHGKAERAMRLLDAEINLIQFEQNVVVDQSGDRSCQTRSQSAKMSTERQ